MNQKRKSFLFIVWMLMCTLVFSSCAFLESIGIDVSYALPSTYTCATCKDTQTVTCSTCGGKKEQTCTLCFGTGKTACFLCNGSGWQNCSYCFGSGFKFGSFGSSSLCIMCGGRGKSMCTPYYICHCIDGKNTCIDCNGNGKEACPDCAVTQSSN